MSGAARSGVLAVVTMVLAVLLGGPAAGQEPGDPAPPKIDVASVRVGPGQAQLVLGTADLPPGSGSGLRVSADGVPLTARITAQLPAPGTTGDPAAAPTRAVMLVLDASGSMGEAGIAAALLAASSYLRTLPSDVQVGLVTFADRAQLLLAPTTDRAAVDAALAGVRAGGNTALLDAVVLAVDALAATDPGPAAGFRLLVLSDGIDTVSTTSEDAARALLADRRIAADVVAFRYAAGDTTTLDALAGAAAGQVISAEDTPQLAGAFDTIARTFYQRVEIELDVPAELAGRTAELTVAMGGATTVTTVNFAVIPVPSWVLLVLLAAIFAAVLLIGLMLAGSLGAPDRGRLLAERITRYGPRHVAAAAVDGKASRTAVGLVDRLLQTSSVEDRLAERLDLAAIRRRPAEWALLCAAVGAALAALLTVLTGSAPVGVVAGLLLGWLGMRLYVGFRIGRRRAAYAEQLPDVLQLVAGSLQAGFSLAQALDAVVRQDNQPAAGEISRALAETRIGVGLEDALARVAVRMASEDTTWVVMAIRIQREVGGNLAEVLLTTVGTVRERAALHRHVRALSAEGRLSAYILIALPIGVGGFLFTIRGEYMRPLFSTAIGLIMVVTAGLMLAIGSWWMSKLIKVEV
jgi:Flp pilus assembly protein TadB